MWIRKFIPVLAILLLILLLVGCGVAAPATEAPSDVNVMPEVYEAPAATAAIAPTEAAAVIQTGPDSTVNNASFGDHMIVKNGDIKLRVKDTDQALDGVTQIVGDARGYIVSSRVWYQDYFGTNYKYATLTVGVPVDQFEIALRRLRGLAVRVLDENDTGEDVTDQYVDLQSQLTNLEATRDRIKSFLDQAQNVDEALRINQQLSDVEGQIEQIKGKMNYLSSRSAFSTITINLEPDLPPVVATPTPTATPSPIQPLGPWDPGRTTQKATNALIATYRVLVDFLIWVFVVFVPIFGPPILVIWFVLWLIRKRYKFAGKA